MAAGAWNVYDEFKLHMAGGLIDLDADVWRVSLYKDTSNCTTVTFSVRSELNCEVPEANGYSSSGKTLSATTWTQPAGGTSRFDSTAIFWSASGGSITSIQYAVIWRSGSAVACEFLMAFSSLSTSEFPLTTGNRLTITPSANGIFELTGG
jgi:hypothetical protein